VTPTGNVLDLEVYRAKGLQPDEVELREGRPITPTRPKFLEKPTHLMPPSSPTRRKRSTSRGARLPPVQTIFPKQWAFRFIPVADDIGSNHSDEVETS
jgi:hypothetical protein